MKKIVYGSLSVLTAVCTVFVAAKAEVFDENRAGGATSEVVESSDIDSLLEPNGLGSLGTPLEGDQALKLDAGVAEADAKALGSASLAENALPGQRAVKASPKSALSQGKITKRLPVSGSSTSSAFSAAPSSPAASSVIGSSGNDLSTASSVVASSPQITSSPVMGLQQSQPAASQSIMSPVPSSQPSASRVISAESSEAASPSFTPIAQAAPTTVPTVPTVPAGNSTLPGPGISPTSETGIEVESDAMESDLEMESSVETEITGPESENSVEIGQPAPAGDDPFGATGSPTTGDTLDTTTESEGLGVDAEDTDAEASEMDAADMDAEASEMDPTVEPGIESDAEGLDTDAGNTGTPGTSGAESLGTPGAESLGAPGAEGLGAPGTSDMDETDALDAEAEDAATDDMGAPDDSPTVTPVDPFGTPPSAPGGTSVPGTAPGEEEADVAPDADFGEETDMSPEADFGDDAGTEASPGMPPEAEMEEEAGFEEEPGLEEDAGLEEEADLEEESGLEDGAAPAVPAEDPSLGTPGATPGTTFPAPGSTSVPGTPGMPSTPPDAPLPSTPSSPLPSAPSQSTPLPNGPNEGSSEPLSPIESEPLSPFEEDAVPGDSVPTSGTESFSSGDRLIGEGFSPFQLSYLAIGGGLEGIPGGNMLLSAYEAGDLSAADIVDAGASTNRLGTDAADQDDYTAGVDRFLELLSREND